MSEAPRPARARPSSTARATESYRAAKRNLSRNAGAQRKLKARRSLGMTRSEYDRHLEAIRREWRAKAQSQAKR